MRLYFTLLALLLFDLSVINPRALANSDEEGEFSLNDGIYNQFISSYLSIIEGKSYLRCLKSIKSKKLKGDFSINESPLFHQQTSLKKIYRTLDLFIEKLRTEKLNNDEKQIHRVRVAMLYHMLPDQFDDAIQGYKDFLNEIKEHPERQKVWLLYSLMLLEEDKIDSADQNLLNFLQTYKNGPYADWVRIVLADINCSRGNLNRSSKLLATIIGKQIENPIYYQALLRNSLILARKKLYKASYEKLRPLFFSEILKTKEPATFNLEERSYQLMAILLVLDGKKRVNRLFRRNPETKMIQGRVFHNLVKIECKFGQGECIAAYKKLLTSYPFDPQMPIYSSEYIKKLKKYKKMKLYWQELQKYSLAFHPQSTWSKRNKADPEIKQVHTKAFKYGKEVANYYYLHGQRTNNVKSFIKSADIFSGLFKFFPQKEYYPKESKDFHNFNYSYFNSLKQARKTVKAFKLLKEWTAKQKGVKINAAELYLESALALAEKLNIKKDKAKSKKGVLSLYGRELVSAIDYVQKKFPTSKKLPSYRLKTAFICQSYGLLDKGAQYLKNNISEDVEPEYIKKSIRQLLASYVQVGAVEEIYSWSGLFLQNPLVDQIGMTKELLKIHSSALFKIVGKLRSKTKPKEKDINRMFSMLLEFGKQFPSHSKASEALELASEIGFKNKNYSQVIKSAPLYLRHFKPVYKMERMLAISYDKLCLFKKSAQTLESMTKNYPKNPKIKNILYKVLELREQLGEPIAAASVAERLAYSVKGSKEKLRFLMKAAQIYHSQSYYFKAIVMYVKALRFKPDPIDALQIRLGKLDCYQQLGKKPQALMEYKGMVKETNVLQNYPSPSSKLKRLLAQSYYMQGVKKQDAFSSFKIKPKPHTFTQELKKKEELMEQAEFLFNKAKKYKVTAVSKKTVERLAEMNDEMGNSLSNLLNVKGVIPETKIPHYKSKVRKFFFTSLGMQGSTDQLMHNVLFIDGLKGDNLNPKNLDISQVMNSQIFNMKDLLYVK